MNNPPYTRFDNSSARSAIGPTGSGSPASFARKRTAAMTIEAVAGGFPAASRVPRYSAMPASSGGRASRDASSRARAPA